MDGPREVEQPGEHEGGDVPEHGGRRAALQDHHLQQLGRVTLAVLVLAFSQNALRSHKGDNTINTLS